MKISKEKAEVIATVLDHIFPDAVEVMIVSSDFVVEMLPAPDAGQDDRKIDLILKEIEPETGIFAALSPITRTAYVYLTKEAIE